MRMLRAAAAAAWIVASIVAFSAAPASANAVTGDCYGTGTWKKSGQSEDSRLLTTKSVVKIPRSDDVDWVGGIGANKPGATGPQRAIDGSIQIKIVGQWVTIDSWSKQGSKLANSGTKHYHLPSILEGVKMQLRGSHTEAAVQCSGSVFVKVRGKSLKNPLFLAGGALFILGAAALVYAGKAHYVAT